MSRVLKISGAALLALAGLGGGGTVWLNRQIQTPEYCGGCHVIAPYYDSWKSSAYPAHTHSKMGIVCQDCHHVSVRQAIEEILSNLTHHYQVPLKEHKVQMETCFGCHGSYADLAERTRNLKTADGFPLGRNPHDSHWGPLECGTCHKMHRTSRDWCSECHGLRRPGAAWNEAKAPVGVVR